jgi:hypothetical protein
MPKYLTQREAFAKCSRDGCFIVLENSDIEKIKSTLAIADSDHESAKTLVKNISKESNQWNGFYKLHYDALHELVEAYLRFEKIKSDNHQCLYAYLCEKHPELELSWDFFEKIRTIRNGINYYGKPASYEDWKEVKIQFNLYIKILKEKIQNLLTE